MLYIYKDLLFFPNKSFVLGSAKIFYISYIHKEYQHYFSQIGKDWFYFTPLKMYSLSL